MDYFGGAGVKGQLHPSFHAYIDCFLSAPFPKAYPRGGGIWDQDPILIRDFRIIRKHEIDWKQSQEQLERVKSGSNSDDYGGGGGGISGSLEEYLSELEEDGTF